MNQNSMQYNLPIHSLELDSLHINILPLDHTNPYDFKREHRHTYYEVMLIENGGCNQLIDFKNYEGYDNSCYIICPQQIHLKNRHNSSGTIIQFTEEAILSSKLRSNLKHLSFYENSAIIFENRPDLLNEMQFLVNILASYISKYKSTNNLYVSHLLQALISVMLGNSLYTSSADLNPNKKLMLNFYDLLEINYNKNKGKYSGETVPPIPVQSVPLF